MNYFIIFAFIYITITLISSCSIRELYENEEKRMTIYNSMAELFATKFETLLQNSNIQTYLRNFAIYFEKNIKDKFIEGQGILNSKEDLEFILNQINITKNV